MITRYSEPFLNGHSQKERKIVLKTNYYLMKVKSVAECILQYFRPSLSYPFVIKIFVLSMFEWPLKTGFTVFFDLQFSTSSEQSQLAFVILSILEIHTSN